MSKQKPTVTDLPPKREGESDKDYEHRLMASLYGDDIRSKGDLRDWKSADFSLASERDP